MFDTVSQHLPTDNVKRKMQAGLIARLAPPPLRGWGYPRLGPTRPASSPGYSHSMVPGGLLVTSSTTRLTSATSLVMRVEIRSSTS